jgi:hypothetical protein
VQAALAGAACLLALLLCVTRNANRPLGAYLRQAGGWYREGGLARLWAKTLEPVPSAAPEFDRLVPPGGRVLVWDGPGNLAWYSHRDIFPTDGLIDGARYSEQLAREGALHFFCTRGVAYIAAFEPPPETAHEHLFLRVARAGDAISFEVFTPLGHRSASGWTMRDEDSMGEIAGYKLGYPGFQTARMRRIPCPAQPASPAAVR